jgi:hypothetical protein
MNPLAKKEKKRKKWYYLYEFCLKETFFCPLAYFEICTHEQISSGLQNYKIYYDISLLPLNRTP